MTILKLIIKEIAHRKIIFVLSMLAVVIAVAFYVLFFTAATAANRETTRLMRDIGFNIRIIPKQTDMGTFYLQGFSDETMPEDYVDVFATQKGIGYNHLVATLNGRTQYSGHNIIIRGLAPEICPPGKAKSPMVFAIEKGTVFIGHEVANLCDINKGSTIHIGNIDLTVAGILAESGSADDITMQCHLADAQAILNKPACINEIKAIDCLCFVPNDNPLSILREQLAELLPEGKVVQMQAIAKARSQQRRLVKNVFAMILPIVIIVCGLWIGILAMTNVRQRQEEIGLARALGYGSPTIMTLF
ncbi:MAG: ABC transporter permease, partial [Anaerohalosphaera sp.]|nr:ABC transporter permease [Anaerohalosphaera sp.]